ncbi:ead/Ea22-like family protein [Escherichia coli]|nr:ead/Ea22-like family protein [Escherichia coli]ECE1043694.1 ead/Ea22-like family protein [Salmonella enterica subsp. enterica]EDW7093218.1 ead/Ea22-like family protein [Salmonella enterica subsp. enterica serovar Urbana]EDT7119105.1 ead/Ea22-like family protein [Salmonella enterica subsp. enterica]EDW2006538.1 ead/Ea22-like family protein [Salmonella enterica subsp. enterica]EEC0396920.1 ead/Ea22-like family protein [Salmonella enterica subsp. enterica]
MSKIDYQTLRERYSPKPVPECSVCGEEMSIQRISGAHVVYACSSYGGDGDFKIGRTLADEHYEKSRVTVVDDSDPDVIALLDELEAAKSKLNEQREYYEGVISDGSKRIAELESGSQAQKLVEAIIVAIENEQERLFDEDYLMDSKECIDVIREEVKRWNDSRAAGIRIKGE